MEKSKGTSQTHHKLYRSKENRIMAGVCGGMADYFAIDPLVVRLIWVVATLFAGAGIIAYIAAIFIIPENPDQARATVKPIFSAESSRQWGIILIVVGIILLLAQLSSVNYLFFRHFHWQTFLAILLVAYGVYLIVNKNKNQESTRQQIHEEEINNNANSNRDFYRISKGKMIGGVCIGLSAYFNMDVTIVRLIMVVATLASGGIPIVAYLAALIIFPSVDDIPGLQSNGGKQ
jgi:phage shock protein C